MSQFYACVNAKDGIVLHTIDRKPATTSSCIYHIDGVWFGEIWKTGDTELQAISNALEFRNKIMQNSDICK